MGKEKGYDNLIPQSERTKEEQRKIARKGGIASGKARLRKKRGRELVRAMLALDLTDEMVVSALVKAGYPAEATNELAMHARQIEKAQKSGDTKAYNAVMKLAGYMEDTINLNTPKPLALSVSSAQVADDIRRVIDAGAQPAPPKDEE